MKQRAPKRPAAERRQAILEGAQEVFGRAGYAASGTGDVARSAGVAPSAIYRHFRNKRDLYLTALREAGPRLLGIWRTTAAAQSEHLAAIREIEMNYYDHLQSRSPYAQLWFQSLAELGDPEVRETVGRNFVTMVDALAALIESGKAAGSVRPDVDSRIAAWHFMSIGLAFDLIHHLGLDAELDRPAAERWGDLFIHSIEGDSNVRDDPA